MLPGERSNSLLSSSSTKLALYGVTMSDCFNSVNELLNSHVILGTGAPTDLQEMVPFPPSGMITGESLRAVVLASSGEQRFHKIEPHMSQLTKHTWCNYSKSNTTSWYDVGITTLLKCWLNDIHSKVTSVSAFLYNYFTKIWKILRQVYRILCPPNSFIISRHPPFNDQFLRRTQKNDLRGNSLKANSITCKQSNLKV